MGECISLGKHNSVSLCTDVKGCGCFCSRFLPEATLFVDCYLGAVDSVVFVLCTVYVIMVCVCVCVNVNVFLSHPQVRGFVKLARDEGAQVHCGEGVDKLDLP